jgi:hypothetical protein
MKLQLIKYYYYHTYYKQHALQYLFILFILHRGVFFTPQLTQKNAPFGFGEVVGEIDASERSDIGFVDDCVTDSHDASK